MQFFLHVFHYLFVDFCWPLVKIFHPSSQGPGPGPGGTGPGPGPGPAKKDGKRFFFFSFLGRPKGCASSRLDHGFQISSGAALAAISVTASSNIRVFQL